MAKYDLRKGNIPPLYPVLLDAHGNVVDGFHRLEANPDWPKLRLDWVKTEEDRLIVRHVANCARRSVPMAERRKEFERLARLMRGKGAKPGEIVKRIAEIAPFTERYIRMLLPSDLKREYRRQVLESAELSEEEKREVASELEEAPKPEPVYSGEDWLCPICGALYKLMHLAPDKHKIELVKAGGEAGCRS